MVSERIIKGKKITEGKATGELLVSMEPISFLGGVDPETGIIQDPRNDLKGKSISGKILAFPYGKGSTVGSYVIYQLKDNGKAPEAIINNRTETIVAVGSIISEIPMIGGIDVEDLNSGDTVTVDADNGELIIEGDEG